MTDKQIIIDGVPVQDCCYFDYENDGYEDSCYIHQNECSAQNCYYKQLKRKEQECEELKNELINIKWNIESQNIEIDNYERQLDQLKAENSYLKSKVTHYEHLLKLGVTELITGAEVEEHANYLITQATVLLREENYKLKQTLTEIKEIAEAESYLSPQSTRLLVHKILQKISEVEE